MNKPNFKSVRVKMLTYFTVVFIIPLVMLGITVYYWVESTVLEQSKVFYTSQLEESVKQIEEGFGDMSKFTAELSKSQWINKMAYSKTYTIGSDSMNYIDFLDHMQDFVIYNSINNFVDDIAIYFNNKDIFISSIGKDSFETFFSLSYAYKDISLEKWRSIVATYNNKPYVLLPSTIRNFNREIRGLTYINSLPNIQGIPEATLIAIVYEDKIKNLLSKLVVNEMTSVYIYDADNKFVTGVNTLEELQSSLCSDIYSQEVNPLGKKYKIEDISYFVFCEKSESLGWKFAVSIPTTVVLAKVNHIKTLFLTILGVLIVVGLGVSYILTNISFKPIKNIMGGIENVYSDNKSENEYKVIEKAIYSLVKRETKIKDYLDKNKPLIQNSYLLKLVNGNLGINQDFYKIMDTVGMGCKGQYFMCISVFYKGGWTSELQQCIVEKNQDIRVFFIEDIGDKKNLMINSNGADVIDKVQCIHEIIKQLVGDVAVGIGNIYLSPEKVADSYREAVTALDYRVIRDKNSIIRYEDIAQNNEFYVYPIEIRSSIFNCIKIGDSAEAFKLCEKVIDDNIMFRKLSHDSAKNLFYNIVTSILQMENDLNIYNAAISRQNGLLNFESVGEVKTYLNKMCSSICDEISNRNQAAQLNLINEIVSCIDNNYTKPELTLAWLADMFGFSQSYLSGLLKKELNCNFMDYITNKRINEAIGLLMNNKMKINDISKVVGYDSDLSFRRAFKKCVGIPPSDFKKLNCK